MNKLPVLGNQINLTSYEKCTEEIISWTEDSIVRIVCAANVHMIMTAYDDPDFQNIFNMPTSLPRMGCLLYGLFA